MDVRAKDVGFVLDQLSTVQVAKLISGAYKKLDVQQVVMFGHSLGGATAAAAMLNHARISGGFDMDGSIFGPVVDQSLSRPFLLMSRGYKDINTDITWGKFWRHLRSWRLQLNFVGSQHYTLSDLPILAQVFNITNPQIIDIIGTIDVVRALEIQQVYVAAFIEYILHGKLDQVLQGPNDRYPEITFPDFINNINLEWEGRNIMKCLIHT